MTHDEMIKKLEIGMIMRAGDMETKIIKLEKIYDNNYHNAKVVLVNVTNGLGETVGSMSLHDLVVTCGVIKIDGLV